MQLKVTPKMFSSESSLTGMEKVIGYFPDLSSRQLDQFSRLLPLYTFWNTRINLISRKDIDNLFLHHILHSLSLARIISFRSDTRIMDAGTGGGFPGIPLAILFPEAHFHLVDSIGKKIKAADAIARETGLHNVTLEHNRMENVDQKFHFIISRAVAALPEFLRWCENRIHEAGFNDLANGIFYLKGGDLTDELKRIHQDYRVFAIDDFFSEPYFREKKIVYLPAPP